MVAAIFSSQAEACRNKAKDWSIQNKTLKKNGTCLLMTMWSGERERESVCVCMYACEHVRVCIESDEKAVEWSLVVCLCN